MVASIRQPSVPRTHSAQDTRTKRRGGKVESNTCGNDTFNVDRFETPTQILGRGTNHSGISKKSLPNKGSRWYDSTRSMDKCETDSETFPCVRL